MIPDQSQPSSPDREVCRGCDADLGSAHRLGCPIERRYGRGMVVTSDDVAPVSPDRDFTAPAPASVNGPRVPAPQGARATPLDDTTDSMNSGPVCGAADAVGHLDGRQASA